MEAPTSGKVEQVSEHPPAPVRDFGQEALRARPSSQPAKARGGREPELAPPAYPGIVKLGLVVGGSLTLWAILAVAFLWLSGG